MKKHRPALALDFGQVLTLNQDPAAFDDVLAELKLERSGFLQAYYGCRQDFDAGISDETSYWCRVLASCADQQAQSALAGHSPEQNHRRYGKRLADADFRSWCQARPAMHHLVRHLLDGGVPVAIVSNMPPGKGDRFVAEWPWMERIPHRLFSGDLGLAKPEPGIFRHLLECSAWSAENVLFVDDRSENLLPARELGMAVHHFTDEAEALRVVAEWCQLG